MWYDESMTTRIALLLCMTTACVVAGCGSSESAAVPTPPARAPVEPAMVSEVETPSQPPTPTAVAEPQVAAEPEPPPQPIFRPSDSRPSHDDQRLIELGIRTFESKHLKLYTDIDPAIARMLPPLMDQAYAAWEEYFGPLPPDREGRDFQMTGYIMADRDKFRTTGLLPDDLPEFNHGRHRGQQFWMNDQEFEYYRRHLMLHEGTHCFMTVMPGVAMPLWYLEGMAELFGTHELAEDGTARFRVMPDDRERFAGQGRITMVANLVADGQRKTLQDVARLRSRDFLKNDGYAWAWALCKFLDTHPRDRDRFRQLGKHMTDGQFQTVLLQLFEPDLPDRETEWQLFIASIQYGYDIERAAIDFRPGTPLPMTSEPATREIATDRGWQSSGVLVEAGKFYHLSATGEFTLADVPKPWISEPQGISFRYFDGMPLGILLAAIRGDASDNTTSMLRVLPVGREMTFEAPLTGTLYLRINDDWSQLRDNRGTARVEIRRREDEERG